MRMGDVSRKRRFQANRLRWYSVYRAFRFARRLSSGTTEENTAVAQAAIDHLRAQNLSIDVAGASLIGTTNARLPTVRNGLVRALINTVIVLGLGDVVRKRILPALAQLLRDGLLYRVVFLDIHVECPFALAEVPSPAGGVEYLQVTDNILPLDELKLGPQALVVIATPCRLHASYAKQCLGTGCRVAVEKPLTKSLAWGQSLLPFGHLLFAMDHFLFKLKMLPHWQEPGMEGEVA